MADDKPSLTAVVKEKMEHEDLKQLTDPDKKKEFLDRLESETQAPRNSLEAIFSKSVKPLAAAQGLDADAFAKKKASKYAPKLAVTPTVTPKPLQAPPPARPGVKAKNPLVQQAPVMPEMPMKHMAGSIDSFVCAVVENMEEMSDNEKEDAGACLQMALGGYLDTHEKVRMAFGFVGLLGLYGGRIKKARRITKSKKEKEEVATKKLALEAVTAQPEFESATQEYLEKLKDDV